MSIKVLTLTWAQVSHNNLLRYSSRQYCTVLNFKAFTGFPGIYTGASKEPDLLIRPDTDNFPSVVVESGWSESWPHLQADMRLWFSAPNINYVILLKWTKLSNNKVKGRIEVWHRNLAGVATLLHSEVIISSMYSNHLCQLKISSTGNFSPTHCHTANPHYNGRTIWGTPPPK